MLSFLSAFNALLQVYGRLRVGKLGLIGAIACASAFSCFCAFGMANWIWHLSFGQVLLPDHEVFGGEPDATFLLPLPLIWFSFQVIKGRVLLTRQQAVRQQDHWSETQWSLWNSQSAHSISTLNFVLSMFGVVALLCIFSLLVVLAVSISG